MQFDDVIERRNTGSLKWDKCPELDPFWVADMDFKSPTEVIQALSSRVQHGVFGYPMPHQGLVDQIGHYLQSRHQYKLDPSHLMHLGGLVPALSLAAKAFGDAGDEVMTSTPVYPPFLSVGNDSQKETIKIPHIQVDGQWTFDFEAIIAAITPKTRVFFLCSPQNPLGRCFSQTEIEQLAEICIENDIVLVSDEVHCDLVLEESKTPFFSVLNLSDELRQNCVVLLSPSKTYNIAGLGYAYAIVENNKLYKKLTKARGHTMPEINCLAYFAAEAAYKDGEPWRQELLVYLAKNRDTISQFVEHELPEVKLPKIEATYLAWMDCRELPHKNPAQHLEQQGLFVSDGSYFSGSGHIRLNFGCPQVKLVSALERIKAGLY